MASRKQEAGATPDSIAELVRDLDALHMAINHWALNHVDKIPRRAASRLAQYRTLLSATITDLQGTLGRYDPKLAASLAKLQDK